jgi:hypothetical protein
MMAVDGGTENARGGKNEMLCVGADQKKGTAREKKKKKKKGKKQKQKKKKKRKEQKNLPLSL